MQDSLFDQNSLLSPLAYRVRPINFERYIGQEKIIEKLKSFSSEQTRHFVLYGPPGCGKTTLAFILASELKLQLFKFNAVMAGVPELRKKIKEIIDLKKFHQQKSILFIDEIHRFNKAQQDALLPHLEKGDFIFLGATTEYPQTSLNRAILSRVSTLELKQLSEDNIFDILNQTCLKENIEVDPSFLETIAKYSNGDARFALNKLEELSLEKESTFDDLKQILERDSRVYDKNSHRHYDVISAFIKSVRGSDADAAILWLAVMLDGGEDIDFIARRLIILASEDIGNADPRALQVATSAHYAIKQIGMPEARIILAQACTYLARAPKSNSVYLGIDAALAFVRDNPTAEVPTYLRNRHVDKKKYLYPHSYPNHWVQQDYKMTDEKFFQSSEQGYEKLQSDYEKRIKARES